MTLRENSKPVPAVGVICFRGEDVLIIRRGKAPRRGEWSIPGGRVEPGESFELAALRELFEETNVRAKLGTQVAIIDANFGTHHYLLHDYVAIWESGNPVAGDDAMEAVFMSPGDLLKIELWDETRSVIALARTYMSNMDDAPARIS